MRTKEALFLAGRGVEGGGGCGAGGEEVIV